MKRTKLLSTFLKIAAILHESLVSARFKAYRENVKNSSYIFSNLPVVLITSIGKVDIHPDGVLNDVYSYCIHKQGLFHAHNTTLREFRIKKTSTATDEEVTFMKEYCNIFRILFPFTEPEFPIQKTTEGSFFLFLVSLQESKDDIALLIYLMLLCEGDDLSIEAKLYDEDSYRRKTSQNKYYLDILPKSAGAINNIVAKMKKTNAKIFGENEIYLPEFMQVLEFFQKYKTHPKIDITKMHGMFGKRPLFSQHTMPTAHLLIRMYIYYYCRYFNCRSRLSVYTFYILNDHLGNLKKDSSNTSKSNKKKETAINIGVRKKESSSVQDVSTPLIERQDVNEESAMKESIKKRTSDIHDNLFVKKICTPRLPRSKFNALLFCLLHATHSTPYSTTNGLPFYTERIYSKKIDYFPFGTPVYSSECTNVSLLVLFSCFLYNPETFTYSEEKKLKNVHVLKFFQIYKCISASRCYNLSYQWNVMVIENTFKRFGSISKHKFKTGILGFLCAVYRISHGIEGNFPTLINNLISTVNIQTETPLSSEFFFFLKDQITEFFIELSHNIALTVELKNLSRFKIDNDFDISGIIELKYTHDGITSGIQLEITPATVKTSLLDSTITDTEERKKSLLELKSLCWYPNGNAKHLFEHHIDKLLEECDVNSTSTINEPVAGPSK
ncbi:uncharacterized protein NESG_00270 [Nematocida ausubeli]|uniref:Uncharacterized protein n=1 Tax=Nematocida ausubeli (strain ATCC PRA-371 / ERTm2) TaxID=1913371 RepID=A0A086J4X6_NEMA1|nr:uncharacterized protein NESG_00270 [Nematocida ausubeli]KFG27194.1 hypothetical protein NESG_00270 [Nematocida ausubeli]